MHSTALIELFNSNCIELENGCMLWAGNYDGDGYGRVSFCGRTLRAHRVAWEFKHGYIPDDLWVLHTCDEPLCINVDHLFLGDHQDNMNDMKSKRRARHGDWNGARKPVVAINVHTGERFEYGGVLQAARNGGFSIRGVSACCNGTRLSHKGHVFKFAEIQ